MPAYDADGTPIPPPQVTGFLPTYDPPGLSIRATFLATDGSRPQELIMEWRQDPGLAVTEFALRAIASMAGQSEVRVNTERSRSRMEEIRQAVVDQARAGRRPADPFSGVDGGGNPITEEDIETERGLAPGRPVICNAEGPGHLRRQTHGCILEPGHDPVEPGGRAHRCGCGGIFATDTEVPDVPGRDAQAARRRRAGEE